ncbi:hypothetical protein FJY93_02095 [Candidatus Kaiserbacteria bacterium]|nr:hypothetical protein [Candidatus Kaiserbacteria bacterium]
MGQVVLFQPRQKADQREFDFLPSQKAVDTRQTSPLYRVVSKPGEKIVAEVTINSTCPTDTFDQIMRNAFDALQKAHPGKPFFHRGYRNEVLTIIEL